jgi:hypothetical protein
MITWSVERETDEPDSKPFKRVQYNGANGEWVDYRKPIADRETGAKKRLAKILADRNKRALNLLADGLEPGVEIEIGDAGLSAYIQTDPRGAALYILRPGDVPEGADVSAYYNRGICVY